MFDTDTFVADCLRAREESEPRRAIRELIERAVGSPSEVASALPPDRAGIVGLHVSPELTVLRIVWGPGMTLPPHDHLMWALIGIYTGGEDNSFYRREGTGLVESGGRALRPGDVLSLGDDAVHSVTNPTTQFAGTIHVYGGDFFATPRHEWAGDPLTEEPYDVARTLARFEAANAESS